MDQSAHILVVDDDSEIRTLLERYLKSQAFRVTTAGDGREMREVLASASIDLIVLDVMLPDASGLDLCKSEREKSNIPIILLTALKEDVDRIVGLELGADDYLGKPFNPRELVARIRAVLRRMSDTVEKEETTDKLFQFEGFVADLNNRTVTCPKGEELLITAAEFDLLLAFLERPGRMLSRQQLLDITQNRDATPFDRSIDVLVSRLRRKLGEQSDAQLIKTQRNGGYQFTARVQVSEGGA